MDKNMHSFVMPVASCFCQKPPSAPLDKGAVASPPKNADIPCPELGEKPCLPCRSAMGDTPLDNLPVAIAYIPFQAWGEVYEANHGLNVGTIFPDLDLPFEGRRIK